ncbi:hypothetical protein BGW42_004492 [Actinomortierella wolfii]|nr:hypothetical protein BGW41_005368 [Actinomortierella wolfii]KAG0225311.1 hypothetical protein BGW42_004492 [Actinomortierella wolfii]
MTTQRTAYVTRIEHFSAAHRLHSPHLDAAQNVALYGKCNHASGHGHNYKVEVTIQGTIDPQTGMVINISDLKKTLQTAVMDPCDHRNLATVFLWQNIMTHLPPSDTYRLYEIKLYETDKNVVVYRGE